MRDEYDDDEPDADDPYVDEDEDDYDAYERKQEDEVLAMLAGDFAENGELDLFGALDFDMLDIIADSDIPF